MDNLLDFNFDSHADDNENKHKFIKLQLENETNYQWLVKSEYFAN